MVQNIIVAIIVILAISYIIRGIIRLFDSKKSDDDCSNGCGGCNGCEGK